MRLKLTITSFNAGYFQILTRFNMCSCLYFGFTDIHLPGYFSEIPENNQVFLFIE